MMVTEEEDRHRQQLRPDSSSDGDDNLALAIAREAKTLTCVSTGSPNPNWSGSAAAAAANSSDHNDEPTPCPDDLPDDDVTTTTQLDDGIKLCKEGCSSPMSINDYDDNKVNNDHDSKSNTKNYEHQPLCRRPSITTPSQSDFTKRCLPEDTFSFFIYSNVRRRTFFWAILVFSFQIAIYAVLAYDITNFSNRRNPLKFPVNVEGTAVRIAEVFAIVVVIITQDDLHKAFKLLRDGFNQDLFEAFGATKAKWILSIVLRGAVGLFGLIITFLLIMQAPTVLDLLLNFLAMEFVSLLDDVVFVLMREGFFGREMLKEAKKLSSTFYHVSDDLSRAASWFTAVSFTVLFSTMLGAWGIINSRQQNGTYMCHTIFLQFGDDQLSMLGTLSGLYYQDYELFGGRISYVVDSPDWGPILAYCDREKRWTLSLPKVKDIPPGSLYYYTDRYDPCNWIAASEESQDTTEDFDVLTTENSQWLVRTPNEGVLPLSRHFIACYDCNVVDNFCGDHGTCVLLGRYDRCMCNKEKGRYGFRCEYPEPCSMLETESGEGFVKTGGPNLTYFASRYYRLEGGAHYRAIYASLDGDNQVLSDGTDIIVFTGLRWILSSKSLFPELTNVTNEYDLVEYFFYFNWHLSNYSTLYVSEPVYIDTAEDTASPLSLRWLHLASASDEAIDPWLQPDFERGYIETSFFCAECNNYTNPGRNKAVCLSNGTCTGCPHDFSGTMCQILPESSGNSTIPIEGPT